MNRRATFALAATSLAATAAMLALAMSGSTMAQQAAMTFFVTSAGSGNGADLGGLAAQTSVASNSRKPPVPAATPGTPI